MDVEKTIEFILEQIAQITVRLDKLTERQEKTEAQVSALTATVHILAGVVRQQQGQIDTILGIVSTLAESQRQTDERLRNLIALFEQWIRRGGDGSRSS